MQKNTKLISTTNPVMKKYVGLSGELKFSEDAMAFFYAHTKIEFTFRTSLIQSYEDKDNILTLHTLNSKYSFEKLVPTVIPTTVQLSPDRQMVRDYIKNIKSKKFYCVLDGGFLEGVESIVSFEKAMTRLEALDAITSREIRDDVEQEIVANVMGVADDKGFFLQLKISTIKDIRYIKQSEFEKVGLLEPLKQFMMARDMLKYEDDIYISCADSLEFFVY
jgi:hypothetical protein